MRIGFLIDSFAIGGTELNAVKVAECLTRNAVELTVFHMQQSGPLRERYEQLGVELVHVPLHGLVSASARRTIAKIRAESFARRLQLVQSHCVYSNIVGTGVRLTPGRRMPLLASRRWTGYSARRGLHTLNRVAQSVADAVLVNSPSLVNVVRHESPFSHPVYVPNLMPEESFRAVTRDERDAMRTALSLPLDAPIVGVVARLEPVKDHRTLLDAWRIVIDQVPTAHLAIIGDGSSRKELELQAQVLDIAEKVHFTGGLSPRSLPHALLDVCVLSSLDEGFPNSLLEAMAQRVPVVSTNVGGVGDLITNNRNGLLVQKGDAQALANALVSVLTATTIDVQAMIAAGSETAQRHREDFMLKAIFKIYETIAIT